MRRARLSATPRVSVSTPFAMSLIAYATSGRATCRACGCKIDNGALRVGTPYETDWGESTAWKHVRCALPAGQRHTVPSGIHTLSAEDQRTVRTLCSGAGAPARHVPPLLPLPAPAAPPASNFSVSPARLLASSAAAAPSTDDQDDGNAACVALGALGSTIVGVRYYTGVVHVGEYVDLVREPRNAYDANAVRVDNLRRTQVGHLPRGLAAVLAPLVDGRYGGASRTLLEAEITGRGNEFSIPVAVTILGDPSLADTVRSLCAHHGMDLLPGSGLAAPPAAYPTGGAGGGASRVRVSTQPIGPRSQEELDRMMDSADATTLASSLPPFDPAQCDGALLTALMPHQATGVAWMLSREGAAGLPPFWKEAKEQGRTVYINDITNSSQDAPPAPVRGGLLADDMGLGKSLQVLACILASREKGGSGAQGGAAAPQDDGDELEEMSLKQLQGAAKKLKVATTGTKAQLVSKVQAARASAAAAAAAATSAQPAGGCGATLIVCPVSVMSGWEEQVAEHVRPGALRVYTYAGAGRNADARFLGQHDIVLVSYNTLATELTAAEEARAEGAAAGGKRKRAAPQGVFAVPWHRIVLDEAHTIRTRSTKAHAAVLALKGARRWCLSGTPIHNKADDAQPLFAFLNAAPLSDWATWQRAVGRPLRDGDATGLARLRVLLTSLALRRTKALLGSRLPPKTVEVHTVPLDAVTREAYDTLFASARSAVAAAAESGGDDALLRLYTPILECLLRMRQACNDAQLVPAQRLEAARQVLASIQEANAKGKGKQRGAITSEEAAKLFTALAGVLGATPASDPGAPAEPDAASDDCAICSEALTDVTARILRACRHAFCDSCISSWASVARNGPSCPLCRTAFVPADMLSKAALTAAAAAAASAPGGEAAPAAEAAPAPRPGLPAMSPKVAALLEALSSMRTKDGQAAKCVVFSQFTSFLDVIQEALSQRGWASARLDGSMAPAQRSAALDRWRKPNADGGPAILLASTRAGGVGLNLTSGSWVFMMEPWWAGAAEEQAWDRCHRLGQTQPVTVVRFVAERSVEVKMLELQAAKAALGRGALTKLSPEEQRAARAADLRRMFEL